MNARKNTPWDRLAAVARRAPAADGEDVDFDAPAGFSTRVVARAGLPLSPSGLLGAGFERLAGRALGMAAVCAMAVAFWGGFPGAGGRSSEAATGSSDAYTDPVGDYLAAVQSS